MSTIKTSGDYVLNFSTHNGEFVQVGTDANGQPLYQSVQAATDPLAILADEAAAKVSSSSGSGRRSNVKAVGYLVQSKTSNSN